MQWNIVLSRFSHVRLCATLWTVTCQAPLSKGFSRQEYWRGLPCPPPEDLHLLCLLHWQVGSLSSLLPGKPPKVTIFWKKKKLCSFQSLIYSLISNYGYVRIKFQRIVFFPKEKKMETSVSTYQVPVLCQKKTMQSQPKMSKFLIYNALL